MTADRRHSVDDRRGAPRSQSAAAAPLVVRGVVRGHVETAVGVLRDQLAEPWTLDLLANEVHLSRSQLVRVFVAVTSLGPMAYLRLSDAPAWSLGLACAWWRSGSMGGRWQVPAG